MSENAVKLLATFFYLGKSPIAPGSVASIAGGLFYLILHDNLPVYALLTLAVVVLGFWAGGKMESIIKEKDPSSVVIDEVAGMMIALFFLPINISVMVTAYFLFRAFDMFKIYPARELENLGGSKGIMMDDVFAGIYTNIVMQIAVRWAGIN
jgi:phosphatidylglycerophosphatase A